MSPPSAVTRRDDTGFQSESDCGRMGRMGRMGRTGTVRNRVWVPTNANEFRRMLLSFFLSFFACCHPVLSFTGSTPRPSICQSEAVDSPVLFQSIHLQKLSSFAFPDSSIHSYPPICLHALPVSIPNSASLPRLSTDSPKPYNPTTPLISTSLCRLIALFPPIPTYHPTP